MKKWILTWAIGQLLVFLTRDQEKIVAYVNSKVDIPRMSEEDEARMYRSILEAIRVLVKG